MFQKVNKFRQKQKKNSKMNFHVPNFNMKNLVKEAGSTFSRVVQLTEERLGTTERTEYDSEFQNLAERADVTKTWTEKIVKDVESVLVPNPQNRVEDFIFEKIDKSKPQRLSNLEYLALDMLEAGADFGQDLPYGQALIKVGQAEQRLGKCERDFIASSSICFTTPLRKFLDGEMKTITKERGVLETKRLDLDACKKRVTKARSMLGQQTAERDLRVAQSEFDRQSEITKSLLEGINTSQASHLRHLHAFIENQVRYYKQCTDVMDQLQLDLAKLKPEKPRLRINSEDIDTGPPNANQNIQNSTIINNTNMNMNTNINTNTNTTNQPTQFSNNKIVTVAVAASETANAAKSLASYCQYDSVDLDNLESLDITTSTTNPFNTSTVASHDKNTSKILDECPTPYQPIEMDQHQQAAGVGGIEQGGNPFVRNSNKTKMNAPISVNADQMKRARVLCAYDAKDHTELTLSANEVILVAECQPINTDYMYGKQGLLKGLVPRAFLEMLDDDDEDAGGAGGDDEQAISGDTFF
ncbi:Endophilin-B1 [Lucilia cuprina]|nr:Endophilin-B1 [Lucilia cuprina]